MLAKENLLSLRIKTFLYESNYRTVNVNSSLMFFGFTDLYGAGNLDRIYNNI